MDVSVVIATCNRSESLVATLESLAESRVAANLPWEVLVVDNNSTDSTPSVVESFIRAGHPNFRYLFEPQQGKSLAVNKGIAKATGGIIAMTDDDCIVDPEWIATILQARRIVLIVTGSDKAAIVERLVRGPVTTGVPGSFLQLHPDVEIVMDEAAAAGLRSS